MPLSVCSTITDFRKIVGSVLICFPAMCYNKVKRIIENYGKEPCICIGIVHKRVLNPTVIAMDIDAPLVAAKARRRGSLSFCVWMPRGAHSVDCRRL